MDKRRGQLDKEVVKGDAGKDFLVPEWVAFILIVVTVNKMPKTIPVFVGFPLIIGFVKSWSFALDVAILGICGITLTSFMAIGILVREGSFKNYLAMGLAENPIGRLLKSRFCKEA